MILPPRLHDLRSSSLVLWLALCCASPALAQGDARHANTTAAATPPAAVAVGPTLAAPEIKPGFAGSFLSSNFARQHEDPQQAAKYLSDALRLDPTNESLMLEAMRMDLLAGDMDEAFNYANKLAAHAKDDPLVATLLMLEEVKQGDYAKAQGWAMQAPQVGLFGVVRPVVLEWLGIGKGDVKGAADLQAAIDKSGFFAPFLTYHMALMNDVLGNNDAARAAYLKASADPAVTPYRVVEALANFYARRGEWDKAQAVFDAYAKANPDSSLIPGKLATVNPPPQPLVANARDGLAELFFTTASILFGEEAAQDTYLYLRLALDLKPDLPPAQLMLANLYEQDGQYERAIATYDSIKPGNVFYRRGQIRKALNLEALERKTEALALLDKIAAENPADNTALISRGRHAARGGALPGGHHRLQRSHQARRAAEIRRLAAALRARHQLRAQRRMAEGRGRFRPRAEPGAQPAGRAELPRL
ncbi:MAG: tetratricopeptide repeat protein [Alphaproteobacteria bacterium]